VSFRSSWCNYRESSNLFARILIYLAQVKEKVGGKMLNID